MSRASVEVASTFSTLLPKKTQTDIDLQRLTIARRLARPLRSPKTEMLKISIVEGPSERRLVVEGKLIEPWVDELKRSWREAAEHRDGRKLVIDLNSATVISHEGQTVLFEMMKEGATFSCGGVFSRHLVQRLAEKCQGFVCKAAGRHSGD